MKKSRIILALSLVGACRPVVENGQTQPPSAAVQTKTVSADSGVESSASSLAAASDVLRHLPGTVMTTATGKYVYFANSDGTLSAFASDAVVSASGIADDLIVIVTAGELRCYDKGETIAEPLDNTSVGGFAEGSLVKERGKSTVYAISDGVAWPIISSAVFTAAGYQLAAVEEVSAGTLAKNVDAVGDCGAGVACLDMAYLLSCAKDDDSVDIELPPEGTFIPAAVALASADAGVTPDVLSAAKNDAAPMETQTTTSTPATIATSTPTVTATSTATASSTGTASATSVATSSASSTAIATSTSTNVIDLSWVYEARGSKLCLNAFYFAGGNKAVLLIWAGPGADAAKGPVTLIADNRFCWDFANRQKGLYTFWADEPVADCVADICPRDAVPGNGAMYMTAPKATAEAKKWLYCEDTGCDGSAYWDGAAFTPMGN